VRILDVSQPVGTGIAVWPGDQTFGLHWTMSRAGGDSVNVAALTLSPHTGTHADGPFHFDDAGARPAELDLGAYIGRALVIDATGRDELDADLVASLDLAAEERVLFRTRSHVDATRFPTPFAPLTVRLAERLASSRVRLVGTDAPSVDAFDSKTLDVHRILGRARIAILENLVLGDVSPGRYTLIALPLKLMDADSSPVRAVLLEAES
jgi:arylformamidase